MTALAPTLEAFFTERLGHQRQASPNTVSSYRDTFRLLLQYLQRETSKAPSALDIADLGAPRIGAFLDHLERDRHNSARTRNARLAAIHSLFRFAALRHPEHAALIERVLAIPPKRSDRALVSYLVDAEITALLSAPDRSSWIGRRDHALLLLAIQTGLRVSELVGLRCADLTLSTGPHVRCMGKGRKERATPLTGQTVAVLQEWLAERKGGPTDPLFPSRWEGNSAPMQSPGCSRNTTRPQHRPAHHCGTRSSRHTCCGTQPPCSCVPQASTSRSSRSGSATRAPSRHRFTCIPTSPSRNRRWHAPGPSRRPPGATDPTMRSSPSSTICDYAE